MPKVEFKRVETDEEVENINIKDGQLIYSKSGKTFMDYGDERIPTGSGGSSVEVDTEMSDTSENAVQNKVIKEYVDSQTVPEEVIISDTQPTGDDWKLWIDSDKQADNTYYNDNGTPTNIKTTTFDTLPVGTEVDYDGETVPAGWTEITGYEEVDPTDYIIISSSFTSTTTAYKIGNLVIFNYDITSGTINNGQTVLGTCTNKLVLATWGNGRVVASNLTTMQPATLIAIPSGDFRIYTAMAGARTAGSIMLLVND